MFVVDLLDHQGHQSRLLSFVCFGSVECSSWRSLALRLCLRNFPTRASRPSRVRILPEFSIAFHDDEWWWWSVHCQKLSRHHRQACYR